MVFEAFHSAANSGYMLTVYFRIAHIYILRCIMVLSIAGFAGVFSIRLIQRGYADILQAKL